MTNLQKKDQNKRKITLKSYYNSLSDPKKELREKITIECGVSERTVRLYISNPKKAPKLVRDKIEQIIGQVLSWG